MICRMSNDRHQTYTEVDIEAGDVISSEVARGIKTRLCPSGCCPGPFGMQGKQEHKLVIFPKQDGSFFIGELIE